MITLEEFRARFIDLCLRSGMTGLPRRPRDREILLKSIQVGLESDQEYTESELNDLLASWLENIGTGIDTDHVALRRALVDTGFLDRATDGSRYRIAPSPPGFDPEIDDADFQEWLDQARRDLERRKDEHRDSNEES